MSFDHNAESVAANAVEDETPKYPNGITEAEVEELQEIFNLVDTDRGGSIEPEEVTNLLNTLGVKTTQEEVNAMIKEIDENSDGSIDFSEFIAVMSRKLTVYYSQDQVKDAFRAFTRSSNPKNIRRVDIIRALTQYGGEVLTKEQADEILKEVEFDENDEFHFDSHIDIIMN